MLEHLARPGRVDLAVGQRQRRPRLGAAHVLQVREALAQPPQRLVGDVDADRHRVVGGDRRRERALAAPDVEHAVARLDVVEQEGPPLLEELGLGPLGDRVPDRVEVLLPGHRRIVRHRPGYCEAAAVRSRRSPP